ncbi:unnamed protein product [Musa acuminata subsp. malaccensis]|uniref:(wild Malaysian banana) hypothetical protein n=1 Tax=Musa acuminata subsp. malaccensis TaxID=214687 RepID=A0A8D6ZSM6_MUSAM|nr:unnamed protein product [Musa acuminata subsp. malaccensis]
MRFLSSHAENLRSVTRGNQLNDLGECVPLFEILVVLVVSVTGRVGSETPINCEQSGLKSVVVSETVILYSQVF